MSGNLINYSYLVWQHVSLLDYESIRQYKTSQENGSNFMISRGKMFSRYWQPATSLPKYKGLQK
jgi:hypothetical protein